MEHSPISQKLTSRFVAGQTLADGIDVLRQLSQEKITGTLDFLGENVQSLTEAARSRDCYLSALDEICRASLPATVSIKLTQFGLNFSDEACLENASALVERAGRINSRVEVDMESSEYTERTLRVVSCLQKRHAGCVRAVIQAYLHRSESDIGWLSDQEIPVRLCKGAYREPPELAFARKADVDANYMKLMEQLLDRGIYPAIASHDEAIIRRAVEYAREKKIGADRDRKSVV